MLQLTGPTQLAGRGRNFQVSGILWLLFVLIVLATVSYHTVTLSVATALVGLAILLAVFAGELPWFFSFLLLIGFALGALVLNSTQVRQEWISRHLLEIFRKKLPALSDTEKEAMASGSVWWEADLLGGHPDWHKLFNYPLSELSEEEQAFLDGPTDEFCAMIDDWQITHNDLDLTPEAWSFLKDRGFMGLIVPKEYGGLGFSARAISEIVMKVSSRSITAACTLLVPNSLGPAKLLLHYGTTDQQQHYLPRLAKGQELPCFALTGPEVGSDASNMPDTGVVCRQEFQGREVLGIRLNWSKRYLTLGPVATVIGLAFRMLDPDQLLGEQEELGITVALIPADTEGVTLGRRHIPLNIPFQNGPIQGKEVFAPLDWIIGGESGIGRGWMMLVECLSEGRGMSLPSLSTAGAKLVSRYTGAYARVREQFGTPIGNFEGVQEALASIGGLTYQVDAARLLTISALDKGEKPGVVSAIAKYHLTEAMRKVVNHGMDIQGGSGVMLGPRNYLGRIYQALPISITVEGANILTRSLMIFGQGVTRAHPWLLKEMEAIGQEDDKKALTDFDRVLFSHLGQGLGNGFRSLFLGITGGRFSSAPGAGAIKPYVQKLNWLSAALAVTIEFALLQYGGELKRKEHLSGRLADILSHLYLASATLKHFQDQGSHRHDLPLLQWSCEQSLWQIQQAFAGIFTNFPSPLLARAIKAITFPAGMRLSPPSDRLTQQVADLLLHPSPSRERLTAGIYQTKNPQEPGARLDAALELAEGVSGARRKIKKAIKSGELPNTTPEQQWAQAVERQLISTSEKALLEQYESLRKEIIQVDDYSAAEFVPGVPSIR